jgi:hypothetical protein
MVEGPGAQEFEHAFEALRRVLPIAPARAPKQFYAVEDLRTAFRALKRPLEVAKEMGGLINPWALAGLGQDEVRNSAALAGLWMYEFGGDTSRRFLASYLSFAIGDVDWSDVLRRGYRVGTEVCPIGEAADRVDLLIETGRHLIGIEVKIRAGLGRNQLERYSASISRRAELQNLSPRIVLLAPFRTANSGVSSTSWADVARAARAAAGESFADRSFVQKLIAKFGEHVRKF